jgi:hypothetical protein
MLTPNLLSAATRNRETWSELNARGIPVRLPVGTVYLDGTVTTPAKCGCGRVRAEGGNCSWPVDNHPTLTGCLTRVQQIGKGPCLRLSGTGFTADDPIEWVGDGESAIIEVEGRVQVPCGRHRFRNQTFSNASTVFHSLAGYYDDAGKFVADENHADCTIVDGCEFYSVASAFRSDNQQSMGWKFRDCYVNQIGDKFPDCVFADLRRGGDVTITGLEILHSRVTIFKVRDYSPNNCRLICRDFHRDRMTNTDGYLTLFEYAGDANNQGEWLLLANGWCAVHHAPFDRSKLYKIPSTLPRKSWKVDVQFTGAPK